MPDRPCHSLFIRSGIDFISWAHDGSTSGAAVVRNGGDRRRWRRWVADVQRSLSIRREIRMHRVDAGLGAEGLALCGGWLVVCLRYPYGNADQTRRSLSRSSVCRSCTVTGSGLPENHAFARRTGLNSNGPGSPAVARRECLGCRVPGVQAVPNRHRGPQSDIPWLRRMETAPIPSK